MAGEFLVALTDASGLDGMFSGPFLRGHPQPRVAVVGRSNVGKSSLINRLLGIRLARVSNQPGKTRAIYFYQWKETNKILADLPGYGYARVGRDEQKRWAVFIEAYFREDKNLERVAILLDSRHGPTKLDLEAIQFIEGLKIPMTFVFTKADTLKTQAERARRTQLATHALKDLGFESADAHWVSSMTRDGLKKLAKTLGA